MWWALHYRQYIKSLNLQHGLQKYRKRLLQSPSYHYVNYQLEALIHQHQKHIDLNYSSLVPIFIHIFFTNTIETFVRLILKFMLTIKDFTVYFWVINFIKNIYIIRPCRSWRV